jgi:hypothetical protein
VSSLLSENTRTLVEYPIVLIISKRAKKERPIGQKPEF